MINIITECGNCVKKDVCRVKEEMYKTIDDINNKYNADNNEFVEFAFRCTCFYGNELARVPELPRTINANNCPSQKGVWYNG